MPVGIVYEAPPGLCSEVALLGPIWGVTLRAYASLGAAFARLTVRAFGSLGVKCCAPC